MQEDDRQGKGLPAIAPQGAAAPPQRQPHDASPQPPPPPAQPYGYDPQQPQPPQYGHYPPQQPPPAQPYGYDPRQQPPQYGQYPPQPAPQHGHYPPQQQYGHDPRQQYGYDPREQHPQGQYPRPPAHQAPEPAGLATGPAPAEQPLRDPDEAPLVIPQRSIWPYLVALVVLVLGGAGSLVWFSLQPVTKRVLVAVDLGGYAWQGSKASQQITAGVDKRLTELGFEVVREDDEARAVLAAAASPTVAARRLKAGFVVSAKLVPEVTRHAIGGGYFEGRVRGSVELGYRGGPATSVGSVAAYSGAPDEKKAVELLGESLADQVFDLTVAALMAHPAVKRLLEATDGSAPSQAKAYVDLRDKELGKAQERYEELRATRFLSEQGGHDVTYHGQLDAEASLCGVGPDAVLVRRSKVRPFFVPEKKELGFLRDLDELLWLGFDGSERKLTSAYNLYGYPSASSDGKTVVYVEDIFGWGKTITVADGRGPSRRVLVDPARRFLSPRVAPDGRRVAVLEQACGSCTASLTVIELKDGKVQFRSDPDQGTISGFDWASANEVLAIVQRPPDPLHFVFKPKQLFYLIELKASRGVVKTLRSAADGEIFQGLRVAPHGRVFVLPRAADDGKSLARYDLDTDTLETFSLPSTPEMPELSPDRSAAVFGLSGEVAHFSFTSGALTFLTRNRVRDRYPVFSADGKRVFYESLDSDPSFPRSRTVSVIASVRAP